MAKINVIGDALVITSTLKIEDIEALAKYEPKALKLYEENEDGKKEEVFAVCLTKKGTPGINAIGASFSAETRGDYATITTILDKSVGTDDALKTYIADNYGRAILLLEKIEAQVPAALERANAFKASIAEKVIIA